MKRDAVLAAVLIAAAILAHAYFTHPPRYQFLTAQPSTGAVSRGDTRTGDVVLCEKDYRGPQEQDTFFKCPPGEGAAAAEWIMRHVDAPGLIITGAIVLVLVLLVGLNKIRTRRKP
jgi:hypothetical protein